MKFSANSLSVLALAGSAVATDIAGVIDIPFTKESPPSEKTTVTTHFLDKRATGEVDVTLENKIIQYLIELDIGTPSQKILASIDTGSSDLWLMDKNNTYCAADDSQVGQNSKINCTGVPTFDPSESSTWKEEADKPFYITYGDGTWARGNMGTEDVSIAGVTVENAHIAVCDQATANIAIFGIGFDTLEATNFDLEHDGTPTYTYPNVPVSMKEDGIIKSLAYSLYLDEIKSKTGHILFGGVDHAKYEGELTTLPIVPGQDNGVLNAMYLEMTEIVFDNHQTNTTLIKGSAPALLDSGTTLNYLPSNVIDSLVSAFTCYGAKNGINLCKCPQASDGSFRFYFNDKAIELSYLDLFRPAYNDDGTPFTWLGDEICALYQVKENGNGIILGDAFLRSAYAVYDLDNKEISLAQAKFDATGSNIEVIDGAVPSATKDAQATRVTTFSGYNSDVYQLTY